MDLIHWVVHQNKLEIPRDKDEVNEFGFIMIQETRVTDKTYI